MVTKLTSELFDVVDKLSHSVSSIFEEHDAIDSKTRISLLCIVLLGFSDTAEIDRKHLIHLISNIPTTPIECSPDKRN